MAIIDVVYADEWQEAVDKPAGVLVHGDGTGARTLSDDVRAWVAARGGDASQVQAVQRLDVETTGLVLFSACKATQAALDAQLAGRADGGSAAGKRYLALVEGRMPARELVCDGPIGRDRHDARRMRVSAGGKAALTRVELLAEGRWSDGASEGGGASDGWAASGSGASGAEASLLAVYLGSGRRHQIRVHLAHLGHPIIGDTLYGGRPCEAGLMLHAHAELIRHPATGERLALRTAWPRRFPRPE